MICYCVEKGIHPGVNFDRYAVLGNDVVIADSQVALAYLDIVEELEVILSKQKSIISEKTSTLQPCERTVLRSWVGL